MDLTIIGCGLTALLGRLPALALASGFILAIFLVVAFALGVVFQRTDCSGTDDVALRERAWPDEGLVD